MSEDILSVYKNSLNKTINSIKECPFLLLLTPVYFILVEIFTYLSLQISFGRGSFIMGFIRPVGYSLLISSYFQMLEDGIIYKRINFKSLKSSFTRYFYQVYSVFFVLIILDYLLAGLNISGNINIILGIIINVILSPISEEVYIESENGIDAFKESLKFMKDNFIHWMIPTAIIIFGLGKLLGVASNFYISNNLILQNIGNSMYGSLNITSNTSKILSLLIFEIILGAFSIFRYHMFKMLSGSSIRKRKFQGLIW